MALSKPSGMLVHRGWARDGEVLVDWVRRLTGSDTAHPIHRLDRATSGIVLFGLSPEIARELGELFQRNVPRKRYIALVRGRPPESGLIDHPIPRAPGGDRVPARSSYRRLQTVEASPRDLSLVEVFPATGRLHQVRRHLKHIDHPVIGDANYGKGPLNRAVRERYDLSRLALHALSLEIVHPRSGEALVLVAPLPDDLAGPLERLGFVELLTL